MSKTRRSDRVVLVIVAAISAILNVLFAINNSRNGSELRLSWSRRAAAEAEVAAFMDCSGHGRAYLDGLLVDGSPTCECHLCYGGPDCSEFKLQGESLVLGAILDGPCREQCTACGWVASHVLFLSGPDHHFYGAREAHQDHPPNHRERRN